MNLNLLDLILIWASSLRVSQTTADIKDSDTHQIWSHQKSVFCDLDWSKQMENMWAIRNRSFNSETHQEGLFFLFERLTNTMSPNLGTWTSVFPPGYLKKWSADSEKRWRNCQKIRCPFSSFYVFVKTIHCVFHSVFRGGGDGGDGGMGLFVNGLKGFEKSIWSIML